MVIKKYKFGKLIVKIESVLDYCDTESHAKFLTDEDGVSYTVKINLVDELPENVDDFAYELEDRIGVQDGDDIIVYYKNVTKGHGFGARRVVHGAQRECTISFLREFAPLIRSVFVFRMLGIEELTAATDTAILHSSVVEHNGKAILFSGPCGMGKSTQADLWNKYRNLRILNGDKALVYEKDGCFMVGGIPYCGSSPYCETDCLPIEAIIDLGQAKTNSARKENAFEAFLTLVKCCYLIKSSELLTNLQMNFIERLSQNVAVINFNCRKDESAVDYLEDILCQEAQSQL